MRARSRGPRTSTELLYGRNAVMEALRGRRSLKRLIIAEGGERQRRIAALLNAAAARSVPVTRVPPAALNEMLPHVNHQGVALETGRYPYVDLATLLRQADGRTILALDHLQDPQNLGTLIRTAEAVGAAGLILPERRSAGVTPAVVNASAGAVEHLSVALVTNLGRAVTQAKEAGYWALALEGGEEATNLFTADLPEPALLIVGSEGRGMAPSVLRLADVQIALPMVGKIESLNAAVAGSIALYELFRRRSGTETD